MKVEVVESAPAFEITYPVVVIGAGACGLSAALAASDSGLDVLVLEQDKSPLGTTVMSTGLIPAAGTPEQLAAGITDSAEIFAKDIQRKAKNGADPEVVMKVAQESAETISWLQTKHKLPLSLVTGFLYPGHSVQRMFGSPGRSGAELMAGLESAALENQVDILTEASVEDLIVDNEHNVLGVRVFRPDGESDVIGCSTLILACCGFAGSEEMVAKYTPEMANATFHGHPGNKGHAVKWGEEMGAALGDMDAYQGHGGLAHGHGIPILWPLIMEGGYQVNRAGKRFSDETKGYSEQAVNVIAQEGNVAWSIFDQRLYELMIEFEDFKDAVEAGAIVQADSLDSLAAKVNISADGLKNTALLVANCIEGKASDEFGRDFSKTTNLVAPFYAAKVTGALFHTQGGLAINADARVLTKEGKAFPNLFAGGGAARGISGSGASGYMAGNGLVTATTLGKIAGRCAAKQVKS
ncbi:FAD-dependent oxidoreductase [Aliiglaciecola sp. SL4]|uniref:FAD-dependent oxidoreductase n=1 Tax=Aliiglaciecola sp. SL4 TaxID=3239806 RepID=UPI00355BD383